MLAIQIAAHGEVTQWLPNSIHSGFWDNGTGNKGKILACGPNDTTNANMAFVSSRANGSSPVEWLFYDHASAVITVNNAIKTNAPASDTAQPWKLGGYTSHSGLSPEGYIRVDINNTPYYLLAITGLT